jgi:hypothetical protein
LFVMTWFPEQKMSGLEASRIPGASEPTFVTGVD